MPSTAPTKPVRERILDTATELFYRDGVRNVGIDEVIARADVAKASLYKHFDSKDDLIAAVLLERHRQWLEAFISAVERRSNTPTGRLLAYFDELAELLASDDFRGCPFTNAAIEVANPRHPAFIVTQEHNDAVYGYFLDQAKAAKLRSPESLARQLTMLTLGAMVTAHTGRQGDVAGRDAREAAAALIANVSE
jgi:AcrR family transcriptional regulator